MSQPSTKQVIIIIRVTQYVTLEDRDWIENLRKSQRASKSLTFNADLLGKIRQPVIETKLSPLPWRHYQRVRSKEVPDLEYKTKVDGLASGMWWRRLSGKVDRILVFNDPLPIANTAHPANSLKEFASQNLPPPPEIPRQIRKATIDQGDDEARGNPTSSEDRAEPSVPFIPITSTAQQDDKIYTTSSGSGIRSQAACA
jgi:hypothetical protein